MEPENHENHKPVTLHEIVTSHHKISPTFLGIVVFIICFGAISWIAQLAPKQIIPISSVSGINDTNNLKTDSKVNKSTETGNLSGTVTIGPNCPVERVDNPCVTPPEAYTSRFVEVYKADGKTLVTKQYFDSKGRFSMDLAPDTYIAKTQTGIGEFYDSHTVIIESGGYTKVNFNVDTGIR